MNDKCKMLKPSLYNMIISKTDGMAVYNTKTGHMIRSFDERSAMIEQLLTSNECFSANESNDTIVKLHKLGFLIDNQCDELTEMEAIEKSATFDNYLKLIILPTEYCNFRCVYCYEQFKRGKMSEEVQKAIIQSVEEQLEHYDGLVVNWFGGEPMEALDVIENLSLAFIRICKNHKKAYNAGMTTNGYNLTVENVRFLKKLHVTEYQITLDGTPAIHDVQRVLRDGSGTSERIIENLLNIKTQIRSSVITIVLRTNFSKNLMLHLDEFQELIDANFSDDSRFNLFWQMVSDYGYVHDDTVRNIFGTKYDYFYLMQNFTKRFVNKYMSQLYGPAGSVCYALKRNAFVISSDGIIKKCTCDMENQENHFGEIGKYFDHNKHENWLQRDITTSSKCYLCIKRPICHNMACHKSKDCLPNLAHIENVLNIMSEKENYYIVL